MSRLALATAALLVAFPAIADGPAAAPPAKAAPAKTVHGKPQAPVSVTTRLGSGAATVTVRFHSAATDASVEVHGVDGLEVTSDATPLSGARIARGEAVTFDVAFTEGVGRSHLAVGVSGNFGGMRRSTVASFAVGKPTPEQLKPAGAAATDAKGQPVKVMPADTR
jgi:hypothetical protein